MHVFLAWIIATVLDQGIFRILVWRALDGVGMTASDPIPIPIPFLSLLSIF